jgi:hypothetical protein
MTFFSLVRPGVLATTFPRAGHGADFGRAVAAAVP